MGKYLNGLPHGKGIYKWAVGALYTGEFVNGLKSGDGKWVKDSKSSTSNHYEGQYFKDKKHGKGVFKWESGNVYVGQYRNDEREG